MNLVQRFNCRTEFRTIFELVWFIVSPTFLYLKIGLIPILFKLYNVFLKKHLVKKTCVNSPNIRRFSHLLLSLHLVLNKTDMTFFLKFYFIFYIDLDGLMTVYCF